MEWNDTSSQNAHHIHIWLYKVLSSTTCIKYLLHTNGIVHMDGWLECEWTNKYVNGIVCQVYGNANGVFVYVEVRCMHKRCRTWMLINWASAIERRNRERKKRWNCLRTLLKPSFMLSSSSSSSSEFIWKRKCLQIGNAFKCSHLVGRFYTKTTTTIAICVHTNLNLENAMKPRNGNFLVRFLFIFSGVSFYVEFRLFNCSWQLLHKIKANRSNCSDFCRMNNNITSIFITLCYFYLAFFSFFGCKNFCISLSLSFPQTLASHIFSMFAFEMTVMSEI